MNFTEYKATIEVFRMRRFGEWLESSAFNLSSKVKIEYQQFKGLLRERFYINISGEDLYVRTFVGLLIESLNGVGLYEESESK